MLGVCARLEGWSSQAADLQWAPSDASRPARATDTVATVHKRPGVRVSRRPPPMKLREERSYRTSGAQFCSRRRRRARRCHPTWSRGLLRPPVSFRERRIGRPPGRLRVARCLRILLISLISSHLTSRLIGSTVLSSVLVGNIVMRLRRLASGGAPRERRLVWNNPTPAGWLIHVVPIDDVPCEVRSSAPPSAPPGRPGVPPASQATRRALWVSASNPWHRRR